MSIKLIKDPIHGNIILSKVEASILRSTLFNRLHHVQQNSLAYFVYPALRTSRFAHSLGVMHVASEIFFSATLKAENAFFRSYLKDMKVKLKNAINDSNLQFVNDLDIFTGEERPKLATPRNLPSKASILCCLGAEFLKFYTFSSHSFDEDDELYIAYCLLVQALRLAALFHDVGHLPGSHLGEHALTNILGRLNATTRKNPLEDSIYKSFDDYYDDPKIKLHEYVGNKAKNYILKELIKEEHHFDDKWTLVTLWLLIAEISNDGVFQSLHSIINSDLDADRLDFILRDGIQSGFIRGSGDVDRLIKQFTITAPTNNGGNHVSMCCFSPAIQSIGDVQEILLDRFRIYKTIVCHHKIRRIEYLLQRAIEVSLELDIEEISNSTLKTASSEDISWWENGTKYLHKMSNLLDMFASIKADKAIFQRRFEQMTDDWLLGILKAKYSELTFKKSSMSVSQLTEREKLLLLLLEEIFKFSTGFESLWKRDYEYRKILTNSVNGNRTSIAKFLSSYKSDLNVWKKLKNISGKRDIDPYEVGQHLIDFSLYRKGKLALRDLELKLETKMKRKPIFIAPCNLKSGISKGVAGLSLTDLKDPKTTIPFSDVSNYPSLLEKEVFSSPRFFIYCIMNAKEKECITKQVSTYLIPSLIEIAIDNHLVEKGRPKQRRKNHGR